MKFIHTINNTIVSLECKNVSFAFEENIYAKKDKNKNILHQQYYFQTFLNNISFSLKSGQLFEIQGFNGSGKSTLFKLLLNILKEKSGYTLLRNNTQKGMVTQMNRFHQISAFSHFIRAFKENRTNTTSILMDAIYTQVFQTSLRNFSLELLNFKLKLISLQNKLLYSTNHLSLGQSNRCQILNLLLSDKIIWILDEPTIGLDSHWLHIFESIAQLHLKNGGIVLFATHQKVTFTLKENLYLLLGKFYSKQQLK